MGINRPCRTIKNTYGCDWKLGTVYPNCCWGKWWWTMDFFGEPIFRETQQSAISHPFWSSPLFIDVMCQNDWWCQLPKTKTFITSPNLEKAASKLGLQIAIIYRYMSGGPNSFGHGQSGWSIVVPLWLVKVYPQIWRSPVHSLLR